MLSHKVKYPLPLLACIVLAGAFAFSGTRAANQSGRSQGRKPDHRYALRQSAATGPAVRPTPGKLPTIQPATTGRTCARESFSGPKEDRVSICEGNVDARIGTYRLQADKVTVYDAEI
jgi:hypothetical protein